MPVVPEKFEIPHVSLCLATSLDGKIADHPDGAPTFTSRYDRDKLFRLRSEADALLVGANTVRREALPPLVRNEIYTRARVDRGLSEQPAAVVLSAGLDLPWPHDYFQKPVQQLLVLTGVASAQQRARIPQTVELIETGEPLDLLRGLAMLKARGFHKVLCEGGGRLVHTLVSAGLVDRLYLTIAPVMIAGADTPGLCSGDLLAPRADFDLTSAEKESGELHLVYQRK